MPTIFPSLRYRDAPRAIDFLVEAFGFERHEVIENPDGTIAHAELAYGDGAVMLGSDREDNYGSHVGQGWMYVVIEDPDAHYARAKAAGAEILLDIKTQDYGGRDYTCRDLEGHVWTFGTYDPWVS